MRTGGVVVTGRARRAVQMRTRRLGWNMAGTVAGVAYEASSRGNPDDITVAVAFVRCPV